MVNLKCAVCGKDAYEMVIGIGRFGSKQPHVGTWAGVWLCKEHTDELSKKLVEMGFDPSKFLESGLPMIPDEMPAKTLEG